MVGDVTAAADREPEIECKGVGTDAQDRTIEGRMERALDVAVRVENRVAWNCECRDRHIIDMKEHPTFPNDRSIVASADASIRILIPAQVEVVGCLRDGRLGECQQTERY